MTPIADMVAQLLAAGIPNEAIIIAVRTAEIAAQNAAHSGGISGGIPVDAVAEKRRAYDRARKRNSTGIPPDSTGIPKHASKENKHTPENLKQEKRGIRLPVEWKPSIDSLEFARSNGLMNGSLETEITKFKNYWIAKSGKDAAKIDWERTWQNWVLNAKERSGGQQSLALGTNTGYQPRKTSDDAILAGMGRIADRRMREREQKN